MSNNTRSAARRTVAAHARDTNDLRHLLDVLDLWPAQDTTGYPVVAPKPNDPGTVSIRSIHCRNRAPK